MVFEREYTLYSFLLQIWHSHRVEWLWSTKGPGSTTIVGRRFKYEQTKKMRTGSRTRLRVIFNFHGIRACGNGTHVKTVRDTEKERYSSREVESGDW